MILMVIAKRVANSDLIEIERKILNSSKDELSILRAHYSCTIKIIANIELKLK